MISTWPCSDGHGKSVPEYAISFDRARPARLLVVPALFDEGNRLRRFVLEAMRTLDARGIDCFLPDLPGCNESSQPLQAQTLTTWRAALRTAADYFRATHVLAIRGGALVAPPLPGWGYAAVTGAAVLRQMIRVRILAAREAGREENQASLLELARREGLVLSGYLLNATMVADLQLAQPAALDPISQGDIGGAGLWLRAEPGEDTAQSQALAAHVAGAFG